MEDWPVVKWVASWNKVFIIIIVVYMNMNSDKQLCYVNEKQQV